jgi:pimeloyl-ACP methyl ester carboxylesterase
MRIIASMPWVLAVVCCSSAASAGEFQHRNLLVGDRAVGLGGAYTALADDPSGMFYNPAGIVHAERGSSTSINALSYSATEYEDILPGGADLNRSSTVVVPGFFGAMANIGGGKGGFFLAVTDFSAERQSTPFSLASFQGLREDSAGTFANDVDSRVYHLGLSLGQPIAAGWSWGGSLALVLRDQRELRRLDALAFGDPSGDKLASLTAIRVSDETNTLKPMLGLHYRGEQGSSVGLTVSREFGVSRTYEYDYRQVSAITPGNGSAPQSFDEQVVVRSDENQERPWHVAVGLAQAISPQFLLTLNVDHYTKVDEALIVLNERAPPVTRPYSAVTNLAAGMEIEFQQGYRLRTAIFTDRANLRLEGAQTFERREQVNLIGASLSISATVGERLIEAGIYGSTGDGQAVLGDLAELNFSASSVVDARKQQFVIFFGAEL